MMEFNFYAPFNFDLGYGVHATNLTNALHRKGAIVHYQPTEPVKARPLYPYDVMMSRRPHAKLPSVYLGINDRFHEFAGSPRIGYSVLEVDRLPGSWVETANQCDAYWAASKWGANVARDSGITVPVAVVPEGVDTFVFRPDGFKTPLPDGPKFRFLTVGKWETRKNIDMAIRAFARAFKGRKDVAFTLMVDNPFLGQVDYSALVRASLAGLEYDPNWFEFVGRVQTKYEVANVMRAVDAFVLPTRGEGWGLPLTEALATGLPCIATNWSAPTDYLTKDNAVLLEPGELIQADDPMFGGYLRQGRWANPSEDELVEKMQMLEGDRDLCRRIGAQARKDMVEKWTWNHAADKFLSELYQVVE